MNGDSTLIDRTILTGLATSHCFRFQIVIRKQKSHRTTFYSHQDRVRDCCRSAKTDTFEQRTFVDTCGTKRQFAAEKLSQPLAG